MEHGPDDESLTVTSRRACALVLVVIACVVVGAGVATMVAARGFSARATPTLLERGIARLARRLAIPRDARLASNPVPLSADVLAEARAHFADHCANCHANDGSGQTPLGQTLYPRAPDMRQPDTQRLSDGELYWIIENGVRLSGMAAFGEGKPDDPDTWKLVHLIRHLREITPEQLRDMEALNPRSPAELEEEREDQQFLAGEDEKTENGK